MNDKVIKTRKSGRSKEVKHGGEEALKTSKVAKAFAGPITPLAEKIIKAQAKGLKEIGGLVTKWSKKWGNN